MMRQELGETVPLPAAQARVTPQELAAAITRLEARRDGEAAGTISIGEAVTELGLTATPEAVWAEVQAARAQQITARQKRPSHRQRLALLSGLGMALIGLVGWWSVPHVAESQAPATAAVTPPPPQAAPEPITLDPNLLVQDASGKLVMLSEAADGQPVKCFFSDTTPPQFLPFTLDNNPAGAWTLIKHEGRVYVRGWIPRISTKALTTVGTDVSGDVSYTRSQSPVPITLAMDGFRVPAGTGDENVFHAVGIHLDQHALEKWKP